MSTYENAPATKLLATHCARCARPLVDSDSVEAGLGPVCREVMGEQPDVNTEWLMAGAVWVRCFHPFADQFVSLERALEAKDAHKAANIAVRYIACHRSGMQSKRELALACVDLIHHLGYRRLAEVLAATLCDVRVLTVNDKLQVRCAYNKDIHQGMYNWRLGRWDKALHCYFVGAARKMDLLKLLTKAFPNGYGYGSKGVFTLKPKAAKPSQMTLLLTA